MKFLKQIVLNFFLAAVCLSSPVQATDYSLSAGWNLLGSRYEMPVSIVLADPNIVNVLIFQDGLYLSSAANQFTTIPKNAGFYVYAQSATTLVTPFANVPPSNLMKLDEFLQPSTSEFWQVLHLVDANLYIAMKTGLYEMGLIFGQGQAQVYCDNLSVAEQYDWRLPSDLELSGIRAVYTGNDAMFLLSPLADYHLTSETNPGPYFFEDGYAFCVKSAL